MKCKICKKEACTFQPFVNKKGQLEIDVCVDCYKKKEAKKLLKN